MVELSGLYDKLIPGIISGADLLYVPYINNEIIGVIDPAAAILVAPTVAFAGASGPLFPSEAPVLQRLELRFYLDEIGDAIRLENSASISQAPEPAAVLLLLAGLALLRVRTGRGR